MYGAMEPWDLSTPLHSIPFSGSIMQMLTEFGRCGKKEEEGLLNKEKSEREKNISTEISLISDFQDSVSEISWTAAISQTFPDKDVAFLSPTRTRTPLTTATSDQRSKN